MYQKVTVIIIVGIPMTAIEKEYLTTAEVKSILKVHKVTVYRWIRDGKLPCYKVGGRLRFESSDVQKLLVAKS